MQYWEFYKYGKKRAKNWSAEKFLRTKLAQMDFFCGHIIQRTAKYFSGKFSTQQFLGRAKIVAQIVARLGASEVYYRSAK